MTRDSQLEETVERIERRLAVADYRDACRDAEAAQARLERAWRRLVDAGGDVDV